MAEETKSETIEETTEDQQPVEETGSIETNDTPETETPSITENETQEGSGAQSVTSTTATGETDPENVAPASTTERDDQKEPDTPIQVNESERNVSLTKLDDDEEKNGWYGNDYYVDGNVVGGKVAGSNMIWGFDSNGEEAHTNLGELVAGELKNAANSKSEGSLKEQAKAQGLKPGTPEYKQFINDNKNTAYANSVGDYLRQNYKALQNEVKEGKTFQSTPELKELGLTGKDAQFGIEKDKTSTRQEKVGQRETDASIQARKEAEEKNQAIAESNARGKQEYESKKADLEAKLAENERKTNEAREANRQYLEEQTRPYELPSYEDSKAKTMFHLTEEDWNDPSFQSVLSPDGKQNELGHIYETFAETYSNTPVARDLSLMTPTEMREAGYTDSQIESTMKDQAATLSALDNVLSQNGYVEKVANGEQPDALDTAIARGLIDNFNKAQDERRGGNVVSVVGNALSSFLDPTHAFDNTNQQAADYYLLTGDYDGAKQIINDGFTVNTIVALATVLGEASFFTNAGSVVNSIKSAANASQAAERFSMALGNRFGGGRALALVERIGAGEVLRHGRRYVKAVAQAVAQREAMKAAARQAAKSAVTSTATTTAGLTTGLAANRLSDLMTDNTPSTSSSSSSSSSSSYNFADTMSALESERQQIQTELDSLEPFVEENGVEVPNPEYEDVFEEVVEHIPGNVDNGYGLSEEQRREKDAAVEEAINSLLNIDNLSSENKQMLIDSFEALYDDPNSEAYTFAASNIYSLLDMAQSLTRADGKPTEATMQFNDMALDALRNASTTANQYVEVAGGQTQDGRDYATVIQDAQKSTNLNDVLNAQKLVDRTETNSKTDRVRASQDRVEDAYSRLSTQYLRDAALLGSDRFEQALQDQADKVYGIDKDPSQIRPGSVEQAMYKDAENMNIPTKGLGSSKVTSAVKSVGTWLSNIVSPVTDSAKWIGETIGKGVNKAIDAVVPAKAQDWLSDRLTDVYDMATNLLSPGKVTSAAAHTVTDTAMLLADIVTLPFKAANEKVESFQDQLDEWYGLGRAVSTGKADTYKEMAASLQTRRVRQSAAGLGEIGIGLIEYLYNPLVGTGTVGNGLMKLFGANQNMGQRALESMSLAKQILEGVDPYAYPGDVNNNTDDLTQGNVVSGAAKSKGDIKESRKANSGDLTSAGAERDTSGWNENIINSTYERNLETAKRFVAGLE